MKILFLHGWHSVPGGVKPTYLKDHGHEVVNPRLADDSDHQLIQWTDLAIQFVSTLPVK